MPIRRTPRFWTASLVFSRKWPKSRLGLLGMVLTLLDGMGLL